MNNLPDTEKKIEKGDVASSVLSRINSEHLIPTPRSHFLLREGVVWSIGVFSVFLGALGVAAIIQVYGMISTRNVKKLS